MRFLFIIQGEGRGHLTQAIALAELIREAGHSVCAALVGSGEGTKVQDFFRAAFPAEIVPFASPALVYSRKTRALSLSRTLWAAGKNVKKHWRGLQTLRRAVLERQPDVVVNFYDSLGGLHALLFPRICPTVCVGHQYLLLHRDFPHPGGQVLDRLLVKINTHLTALGAARKLALSFYPAEAGGRMRIMPPLLRRQLREIRPEEGNYYLAYVTQAAMAEDILAWKLRHPEVEVHCFTDGPWAGELCPKLYFHPIDAEQFLARMRGCRGLISTAGFESVAEAMLLGKPVLMVPLPGHYEQTCNALDAQGAGAGLYRTSFDADALLEGLPVAQDAAFRDWVEQAGEVFFREVAAVLRERRRTVGDWPAVWSRTSSV